MIIHSTYVYCPRKGRNDQNFKFFEQTINGTHVRTYKQVPFMPIFHVLLMNLMCQIFYSVFFDKKTSQLTNFDLKKKSK